MKNETKNTKLFDELSHIIEEGKKQIVAQVNRTLTLVYWQVGNRINTVVLQHQRASYGEEVIETLSRGLEKKYGRGFSLRNIRRMIQFSQLFPDFEIVSTLSAQLSWSHFIEIMRLKNEEARYFYAKEGKNGIMVAEYWTELPPKRS